MRLLHVVCDNTLDYVSPVNLQLNKLADDRRLPYLQNETVGLKDMSKLRLHTHCNARLCALGMFKETGPLPKAVSMLCPRQQAS